VRRHRRSIILLALSLCFFLGGVIVIWAATLPLPDLKSFEERRVAQSTKIYDRTGKVLLFDLHENKQRTNVSFDSISRNVKNATVAIEDAEFYEHGGIRIQSIIRAVLADILIALHLSDGYRQGGSTITQQVVKNSVLTQEQLLSRKLKEWVLAIKLERTVPKEKILEIYLNEAPYGGNLYGIEEASNAFFGKTASDVTLAEAAYLAALPQAPTYYSPYGSHRDALDARKNLVLAKMLENGFITEEELAAAKAEQVTFVPVQDRSIKAAHFVFYVREYLVQKYGEEAIAERGLRVTTTLDYSLQAKAEAIVAEYARENEKNFNAENAGMTAIDPKTGQILVMVGSRNYFDDDIDGAVNITLAKRQPGSSFKPFVYAAALAKGYTPETVVFDVPIQFSTTCARDNFTSDGDKCYSPQNYDNIFRGPVTFRSALAQSLNVPSVQVFYLAGLNDSLATAKNMGISTLTNIGRYGLTLVLGGGEVTLLDMTSAYSVFANQGIRNTPASILRVEDNHGNVLEEYEPRPSQVLDSGVANTISDMLSDNVARAPSYGTNSALYFPGRSVAVKTGTTNDYRDAWILGYTPSIVVGAWAGNNDNTPMEKKVAGFIVAPMWNAFMQEALKATPEQPFPEGIYNDPFTLKPVLRGVWQGGQSVIVDKLTGAPATEATPTDRREERVVQNVHSILYWLDKNDPRGPQPANPQQDSQFDHWEYAVQRYLGTSGIPQNLPNAVPVTTAL